MTLPVILPTGALASGAYVDYMLGYLNTAMDDIADQLNDYSANNIIEDWDTQWDRTVDDITTITTTLSTDISTLKQQIRMAQDAINKL